MGTKKSLKKNKKMRKDKDITIPMESPELFKDDKKSNKTEVETNKDLVLEKKRKRKKEQKIGVGEAVQIHTQDSSIRTGKKKKKVKTAKNSEVLLGLSNQLDDKTNDGLKQQNGGSKARKREKVRSSSKKGEKSQHKEEADTNQVSHAPSEVVGSLKRNKGKSKEAKKKKKKDHDSSNDAKSKESGPHEEDVYLISSGDEDSSKGMKKWILEYHQSRPGLTVLQQRIDEFITAHEEKLEQERKEREARAAEGGWTVVTHHKGRKKTTEAETGVTVGSVAQAVVEDQLAKKKSKQVGLDFYRFQKKEAHRNDIMTLQSKFKEDMQRLQQLRAARKFRPY